MYVLLAKAMAVIAIKPAVKDPFCIQTSLMVNTMQSDLSSKSHCMLRPMFFNLFTTRIESQLCYRFYSCQLPGFPCFNASKKIVFKPLDAANIFDSAHTQHQNL